MNQKTRFLTRGALIAALYVALTMLSQAVGLASGVIQLRLGEALTVLPAFTSAAIPGLAVGCLLANLLCGCLPLDILFGTVATLLGAVGTYLLRKKSALLAPVPPIAANTLIIPFILQYVYRFPGSLPYHFLTIFVGELLSCGVLGLLLYVGVKHARLFPQEP